MANYRTSRILPTILTIIVIVIAIAGLVALARLIFTGSATGSADINLTQQHLLDTNDGQAVSMTVRGPIVADEDFRSYQIVISPSQRKFTAFTGYLDVVTNQQSLSNNTAAYSQFVNALNKANFAVGAPFEGDRNNVLGICATGMVYEFRTLTDGQENEMLWTSTCSGSKGSLRASVKQLSQLFLNQVPDGSDIIKQIRL